MLLFGVYACILILILLYCILSYTVRVQIGKPPIDVICFAYKYSYLLRKSNFGFLKNSKFSLKTHKMIKFCYSAVKNKRIEFAQGVVLSENGDLPDEHFFNEAERLRLNFFTTPSISHAVYLEFPIFLCIPLTKLFAVMFGYPTIRRFSKMNDLCAYPVIEIYSTKSVIIILPLVSQDYFVVPEAEQIIFGKSYSALFGLYESSNPSSFKEKNSGDESLSKTSKYKTCKRIMKG